MAQQRALVIGAGIAGLATALALTGDGWTVEVLERSVTRRASGGGIGIMPNGTRALDELGVGDRVREVSTTQLHGGVRAPDGRWMARQSLDFVQHRFGEPIRALLRSELTGAIEDALPPGSVRFGTRAHLVDPGTSGPALVRVDGTVVETDLVVGADGIRSAVRRAIRPGHAGLRDCGSTSWRAVVPGDGLEAVPAETWGRGRRLSVLPLPDGMVHFSALARSPLVDSSAQTVDDRLRGIFGQWHEPVPSLLRRAEGGQVYADRIEELARPLRSFTTGRVVLVGDAAHPMTPNVGSANLALEDAVELAHALGGTRRAKVRDGLDRFDEVRPRRAAQMARASRWMGRVAELGWPPAAWARDTAVRVGGLLPASVSGRSMDAMAGWTPPRSR